MCHHSLLDSCYNRDVLTCLLKCSEGYKKHEAGAHVVQAGTVGNEFVQHGKDTTRCNSTTQGGILEML